MSKANGPDLKRFMDKKISIQINCGRQVTGILRGYDSFMNIVLDEATENLKHSKNNIGTVVIRGTSIMNLDSQQRV